MQRLLLSILISFFFITSCQKSTPEGIIPEKQMVTLMMEVHTIDGYLNTLPIDSSRRLIDGLYAEIFAKYGLDSLSFQENVSYYLGNAVKGKEIYTEVLKGLNTYEEGYRREDSIRNAAVADSVRLVNRYRKEKEEVHKLIFEYPQDTVGYDYLAAFSSSMEVIGLRSHVGNTGSPVRRQAVPTVPKEVPEVRTVKPDTAVPGTLRPLQPQRQVQ